MTLQRHPRVELLESRSIHAGRVFDVREERARLPSGLEQQLVVIDHPGAVVIAPLLDDGRVALVRQYRHAIGAWLLELPAGRLERGEEPECSARRELEEEVGYRARRWKALPSFFPAPGFCSELMHVFVATELETIDRERRPHDADEELEVVLLPLEEAWNAAASDAKSWIALTRLVMARRANVSIFD